MILFSNVSPADWAIQYDIDIPVAVCKNCGNPQIFEIPFAHKQFRGLMANHTACGEEFRQAIFTPAEKSERERLGSLVTKMFGAGL
jgi:hypothetical protein